MQINNKRGFTLVEVLISISILAILFTFISKTINETTKLNKPLIEKADNIYKESKIFKMFVKDFSQAVGIPSIVYGSNFDIVRIQTKNSIYNIIRPYVTYYVSKKNFSLIRTESLEAYDLYNKEEIYKEFIYGDILTTEVQSFKIFFQDDKYNILLRSKNLNPIVLKFLKVK